MPKQNTTTTVRRESEAFQKLLWSESTEEEYLKQMVGGKTPDGSDDEGDEELSLPGAIKAMDEIEVDENASLVEYLEGSNKILNLKNDHDETCTLPGAIKAMEGLKIDDDASMIQRRHVYSFMEQALRLQKNNGISDSDDSSSNVKPDDDKSYLRHTYLHYSVDDDDNHTVDEMIEALEREEETNLNHILERTVSAAASTSVDSGAQPTSTKDIRMTIRKTFQDKESSPSYKKKTLQDTMNNNFDGPNQYTSGNDSLAGNETIGNIVSRMMDNSTTAGESQDERTLRSWTDFHPIAGSVATMSRQSVEDVIPEASSTNNKFVTDDTSVGSISEEIEVIVAKHKKQLDDEVGAIHKMESGNDGEAVSAALTIPDTMVSSLSFDATHFSRVRSQLGVMPSHEEVDEDSATPKAGEDIEKGDTGEEEAWWVKAERLPTTPERGTSVDTPSPQNSVGKHKDAPNTPSTVCYNILGLATPDASEAGDSYDFEYKEDAAPDPPKRFFGGFIGGLGGFRFRWGRLSFLKRTSERYGNFFLYVIIASVVMLALSIILLIAAAAKLGGANDPSPVLQDAENGSLLNPASEMPPDSPSLEWTFEEEEEEESSFLWPFDDDEKEEEMKESPVSPSLDWTVDEDEEGMPLSPSLEWTFGDEEEEVSEIDQDEDFQADLPVVPSNSSTNEGVNDMNDFAGVPSDLAVMPSDPSANEDGAIHLAEAPSDLEVAPSDSSTGEVADEASDLVGFPSDLEVAPSDSSANNEDADDMGEIAEVQSNLQVTPSDTSANKEDANDMSDIAEVQSGLQVAPSDTSANNEDVDDMSEIAEAQSDQAVIPSDSSANEDTNDLGDSSEEEETQNVEDSSVPTLDEPANVETESQDYNMSSTPSGLFPSFESRLRNALFNTLPESLSKLEDQTSPQFRALEWLRANTQDSPEIAFRPVMQKYVLLVLYFSTSGENWFDNTGWLDTSEECEWFSTAASNSICDKLGRVIEIDLRSNNLFGTLPTELVLLKEQLVRIRVNGNFLKGTLPSFLEEMTNLQRFHAHWNSFSGTIPKYLSGLNALKSLRLGHNDFVGTIPSQLGGLPYLDALNFESNELTGTIPNLLGELTNLTELDLSKNELSGTIPISLMKLSSMINLKLDRNNLTGSMPTEVCSRLPALEIAQVDCSEVSCWCCEGCND